MRRPVSSGPYRPTADNCPHDVGERPRLAALASPRIGQTPSGMALPERRFGRIQAFYEVQAQRVELVSLAYRWPETNGRQLPLLCATCTMRSERYG